MNNQISKNEYVLDKMIVWLINLLELNLCRFDSSERDDIWKKNYHSPTLKKIPVQIYPLEKYILK